MKPVKIIEKYIKKNKGGEDFDLKEVIEDLKNPSDIKKFYEEYIEWLKEHGASEQTRNNPKEAVDLNIGHILGCYDKKTANLWYETLESIEHPGEVFKKGIGLVAENKI